MARREESRGGLFLSSAMKAPAARCLPVRVLGELSVGSPDAPLGLPASRKTRALFAYLAVTASRHRRSELCSLFWEDAADPRAALRWSLTQLRHALGDADRDVIVADRDSVGLCAERIAIDATRLEALTRHPQRRGGMACAATRDALMSAGELFRGEFLDGLDLPACYAYREWCMAEREALSRIREEILVALIEHDRERPEQVLAHARALVARNPLNERGHVAVITALGALGRSDDAKAHYAQCRRIFENELGLAPPAELDTALAVLGAPGTAPLDPGARGKQDSAAPAVSISAHAPLVGRDQEAAQLAAAIGSVAIGAVPDVLLVSGVPGIGKSRLLDELERQFVAADGRALRGRAFEAERLRPFGLWIDLLRSVNLSALPPELQSALRPLVQAGADDGELRDRDRLFDAVCDALSRLACEGSLAILVDDLQWIEDSSVALLHYAMRRLAGGSVLFALCARAGELEDNAPAQQLIAALAHERRLRRIALGPLRDEDAHALVREADRTADVDRIVAQARGHPLMLLELTRSSREPDGSSVLLEHILDTRLSRLSPGAAEMLGWAAAFGHDIPLEDLVAARGIEPGTLDATLSELERHDLLRASGHAGYEFCHDLIRQAAYSRLSPPRRRLIHNAISVSTSRAMETDPRCAAAVAHHADLGAQHVLATHASIIAGEHALRLFANREAAEFARLGRRHALRLADRAQRSGQGTALLRIQVLATSSQSLARLRPDPEVIERTIEDALACGLHKEVSEGHYLLSILHQEAGRIDAARNATLMAAEVAERADRLGRARQLANSARCLVELGRDIGHARVMIAEAEALADSAGVHEIEVRWCRGLLHHWDGELEPALAQIDRAIGLATEQEDRWRQCRCLAVASIIELERHAPEAALAYATTLSAAARRMGDLDVASAPLAQALAALAHHMTGAETLPLGAAMDALREADDKSRLAGVLNLAAASELARGEYATADAFATEALAMADAIGDASEATVSQALSVRVATALGDPQSAARAAQRLGSALDAPDGLNARAVLAAEGAMAQIRQDRTAAAGAAQ